jgi:hypothetical protein
LTRLRRQNPKISSGFASGLPTYYHWSCRRVVRASFLSYDRILRSKRTNCHFCNQIEAGRRI